MSKAGVVYNLTTEEINGLVQVSQDADLLLNFNSAIQGLIQITPDHPVLSEQLKWRVSGGSLLQKATVTISVDKTTFAADGVEEVLVTLSGLVADVVLDLGGGLTGSVTVADPTHIITSDVRMLFSLQIIDNLHWSEQIIIEAT